MKRFGFDFTDDFVGWAECFLRSPTGLAGETERCCAQTKIVGLRKKHSAQPTQNILKLFILILFCWSSVSFALTTDKQQNAYISADSATINHKTYSCIYRGHVKLTQGTTVILADVLTTYSNAANKLQKAVAEGKLASYSTQPDNSPALFIALAQTINYDPIQSQVLLIGDAKATQGTNSFAGPRIKYDIKQQSVIAPASKQGRTTMVFQPGEKVILPH